MVREMKTVAELRFPIDVQALSALTEGLRLAYGPDLTLRAEGDFMVVERPGEAVAAADEEDRPPLHALG